LNFSSNNLPRFEFYYSYGKEVGWETAQIEARRQLVVIFQVPDIYDIEGVHEDEDWKGVRLKMKPIELASSCSDSSWQMY
jgi:hypothetical protein